MSTQKLVYCAETNRKGTIIKLEKLKKVDKQSIRKGSRAAVAVPAGKGLWKKYRPTFET